MNKTTFGRLLGVLGLVLVLSAPLTWLLLSADTAALVKLGLGVLALAAAFGLARSRGAEPLVRARSGFFAGSTAATVAVAIALLVAVNFIAARRNKTWDITSKKVNSLAAQTTTALKGLKEKVTAVAFADPKDPFYPAMEAILARYRSEAPDQFDYRFVSPKRAPDLVQKYQLRQGQSAIVLTRGQGAAESHTTVNVPAEQELTNGLIKLSAVGEKKVYFMVGHGEWALEPAAADVSGRPSTEGSVTELKRDLTQEGYAPEALNLVGKAEMPRDAALVIVAGPKQPLAPPEVEVLRKYLAEGGRVAIFLEPLVSTGLDQLVAEMGIQIDPGIVADGQFAVDSPYNILSIFYGNHEITRMLRSQPLNTQFDTARGLTLLRDGVPTTAKAEPLVTTSPGAWEESTPDQEPRPSSGEKVGSIPIAAVSTRQVGADAAQKREDEARLVVFGDSDLLVDAYWGHEGNRNLVLNALAWASSQIQKVTIRPPDRDISTIDLDKDMLARIRLISSDLLPLTVLALGLTIRALRRSR